MAGFHDIRFPIAISRDSKAGVQRQTDVVSLRSGAEERNSLWALGRRKYNAGYGTKTLADLQAVVQFFEARRGRFFGFRWKDYLDHASSPPGVAPSALDQSIGTGTGTTFGFQLVKLYGDSFDPFARAITKPVSGTVLVAVAGVQKTYGADYAVDTTTGMVTFGTAPASGAPVTAGFQFDVPVRFDTDYLEVNLSSIGYGEAPNIPIIEIRT